VAVGLFMLAGLTVLGFLLVLFGETPAWLGGAEYELTINFQEVEGVSEGVPIYLNGVQVGRVGRLEFDDPQRPALGVRVVALIKDKYYIPGGAVGRVYAAVFGIGRGHIEIVGPPVPLEPLDREAAVIEGEMGNPFEGLVPDDLMFSVDKTVQQIGNLFEAATPVADALYELLQRRPIEDVDGAIAEAQRITANISTVVQRFDHTLKHFNEVLGDPKVKSAIVEAIENIEDLTAEGRDTFALLRETAAQVQQDLDELDAKVDTLVADTNVGVNEIREHIVPALKNLAKLTNSLDRAALQLAEGEGTAGLLLRDARLYEALLLSAQRITQAVDRLRWLFDKFEKQGYIEFKAHEAVGPLPYQGKKPIPDEGN
jgi:ABC-type transporter Mla subunit MlaD